MNCSTQKQWINKKDREPCLVRFCLIRFNVRRLTSKINILHKQDMMRSCVNLRSMPATFLSKNQIEEVIKRLIDCLRITTLKPSGHLNTVKMNRRFIEKVVKTYLVESKGNGLNPRLKMDHWITRNYAYQKVVLCRCGYIDI